MPGCLMADESRLDDWYGMAGKHWFIIAGTVVSQEVSGLSSPGAYSGWCIVDKSGHECLITNIVIHDH